MLAIRLQRTGRKGLAQFRVVVQDSHRSPSTGKVVAYLGSYDPHTKVASLDKEGIEKFLKNGAQPSNRVAILLKKEGYKLPKWVSIEKSAKKTTKNPEKLRKNRPDEPKTKEPKAEETIKEVEEVEEVVEEVEEVEEVVEEVEEVEEAEQVAETKPEQKVEKKPAEASDKPDEK